jgi:hypothetical protein
VAATYLFTLVGVGGSQAQGGLGKEELGLGERSEHKDIHSLRGCKHGDHALGRGGTWTSGTGPDRDSEVTVDRSHGKQAGKAPNITSPHMCHISKIMPLF